MYRTEWQDITLSDEISDNLHGGNFVATVNTTRPNDSFTDVADALGLSSVRFPGGDLTERFLDPGSSTWEEWVSSGENTITLDNGRQLTTVRSFIDHAIRENLEVSFVLPTEGLLIRNPDGSISIDEAGLERVVQLATDLATGAYGNVTITQFEIGNEYYVNGRLTAAEYGFIADRVSEALGEAFEEVSLSRPYGLFHEPDILVQAGPPWQEGDNQTIIDALGPEARSHIDGVIIHWYPRNLERVDDLRNNFEVVDLWQDAEGLENVDLHVTEWNVFNSPLADTGLQQASTLIEGYETLAIEDVESADIWGVLFPRLVTRLAVPNSSEESDEADDASTATLTPAGEVIRSLFSTTAGLHVIDVSASQVFEDAESLGTENADYSISAFGNEDRAVVYVSPRGDEQTLLRLDTDGYFNGAHHIVVQTFEAIDDPSTAIDEADPEFSDRVQVVTQTYTVEEFQNIEIDLGPGEIARIEFVYGDNGAFIEGQTGSPDDRFDFHDSVEGSVNDDTIVGHAGNDALMGDSGNDLIYGGANEDRIFGGFGRDVLSGGTGDDTVVGGGGADVVILGSGNDSADGGQGADLIFGGDGANTIAGGAGEDTLVATGNDDVLSGGSDRDVFSISTTSNSIIEDWSYEGGDQISFQGQYESPDDVRDRMIDVNYADGRPGDLLIEHDNGTSTVIRGAAGKQDAVIERLFDHQPLAINTLDQVELLNSLSPEQVESMMEMLDTSEYEAFMSSIDPSLFAQNLAGGQLSGFLNGLDATEARGFIQSIPEETRHELLREMAPGEINEFLSTLDYEQTIALLQEIDGSLMAELAPTFDLGTRSHLEHSMARFYSDLESVTIDDANAAVEDTDWIDRMLDSTNQPAQPPEDDPNPEDEDDPGRPGAPSGGQDATAASCFVATVVYADPYHPDIWLLRWYRDEIMRRNIVGRIFIVVYWALGPHLAKQIGSKALLVHAFYFVVRTIVMIIAKHYGRQPGRQPDHREHPDSRHIKISDVAKAIAQRR